MEDLASLGFRVDSRDLKSAASDLDRLGDAGSRADRKSSSAASGISRSNSKIGSSASSAGGMVSDAMASASTAVANLDSQMSSLNSASGVLTATLGALSSISAGYAVSLANNVKEQQAWADATGVSLQVLQSWGAAAKTVGRDVDYIGDVFKDTSEKIGDFVATGGGEAADVFEQLGIAVEDLQNLSPDQQLLRIASALDQVGTRGEKLFLLESLANDASLLLPLLENNAAGLREVTGQAERLGVVISDADASKLIELSKSWTEVTQSVAGLGNELSTQYASDIKFVLDSASAGIQQLTEFVRENKDEIKEGAQILAGALAGYVAFTAATKTATVAMGALNAVMRLNPVGLLVSGLALAAGGFAVMAASAEDSEDVLRRVTEQAAEYNKTAAEMSRVEREAAIASTERAIAQAEAQSDVTAIYEKRAELFELQSRLEKQGHKEQAATVGVAIAQLNEQIAATVEHTEKTEQLRQKLAELRGEQSKPDGGVASGKKIKEITDASDAVDMYVAGLVEGGVTSAEMAQAELELTKAVSDGAVEYKLAEKALSKLNDEKLRSEQADKDAAEAVLDVVDPVRKLAREFEAAQRLWEKGLLTDDQLAAFSSRLGEMADPSEKAGADAGKKFSDSFIDAADLGGAIAESLISGDWSGVGRVIGSSVSGAISGSVTSSISGSLTKSLGESAGGMVAGVGGSIVGGLAGAVVGGLLAGSKKEMTGSGYRIGLESGEVFSAEFSKSFKKSSMFSSSSWTEYSDMLLTESEVLSNTFERTIDTISRDAEALGISLDEYSGTLENKNGDLVEANEDLANIYANSGLAALEKYQELGETASDTFERLAEIAKSTTESLKLTGVDPNAVKELFSESRAKELMSIYKANLDDMGVTDYEEAQSNPFYGTNTGLFSWMDGPNQIDVSENVERYFDAFNEATIEYDNRLNETIENLKGLDPSQGVNELAKLAQSFSENYLTETERLQNTMRYAKQEFLSLGFSEADLSASVETVKAFYDAATSPEDRANALVAADALARYNDAVSQQAESAEEAAEANRKLAEEQRAAYEDALKDAFSDLSGAISSEISLITEAYRKQKEAIESQIDLVEDRISDTRRLSDSIRSTLNSMEIGSAESQLQARQMAQAQVTSALAIAQAGGPLPTADSLDSAFETLAKPSMGLYATMTDYVRAQSIAANQIAALGDITDEQLTTDERILSQLRDNERSAESGYNAQITALDDQLAAAERQYNALLGIDDKLLTIAQAQAGFDALANPVSAASAVVSDADIQQWFADNEGATNADIYSAMQQYSVSVEQLARAMGWTIDSVQREYNAIAQSQQVIYQAPAPVVNTAPMIYQQPVTQSDNGVVAELKRSTKVNEDYNQQLLTRMAAIEADVRTIRNIKREETAT